MNVGLAVRPDVRVRLGGKTNRRVLEPSQGKKLTHHALHLGVEDRTEDRRVSIQIRLRNRGVERQRAEKGPIYKPGLDLTRLFLAADAR